MKTGYEAFAVITVVDGKPVVDLGNTAEYTTITTRDGAVCIVSREYESSTYDRGDRETNTSGND